MITSMSYRADVLDKTRENMQKLKENHETLKMSSGA